MPAERLTGGTLIGDLHVDPVFEPHPENAAQDGPARADRDRDFPNTR